MKAECMYDIKTKTLSIAVNPDQGSEFALFQAIKKSGVKPKLVTEKFGEFERSGIVMELGVIGK